MTRPYRPANGTEGDCFIEYWCGRCLRDQAYRDGTGDSCPIVAATLALNIDDPDYPKEWIQNEAFPYSPRCTAFVAVGDDPEIAAARADSRQLSLTLP